MQRVLVTGGAGFIGSNLIHLLLRRGYSVLNVDKLTYAGNVESLSDVESYDGYRFAKVDLCDAPAIQACFSRFQPDAVIHLAAESHVDRSIDGPQDFIQTNIVGTYHLLQASLAYQQSLPAEKATSFRLIHVSTDEVYGTLGDQGLFTEHTRYDPHSPYSASKAASDHLVRAWHHTYRLPSIVTNCSNNYGPFQFPEKLVPVVILNAIHGKRIPVYGQGLNVRDWLFVEDHCEAILLALTQGKVGATYNIGGNNELRNIELVQRVCSILDRRHPRPDGKSYTQQIEFVEDRPGHDFRYAIDASLIREELGWRPACDQQTGFEKTVDWYLSHTAWWQRILTGEYRLERIGLRHHNSEKLSGTS